MLELVKSEERKISASDLSTHWREAIGPIAGAEELNFKSNAAGSQGMPIDIQLTGTDFEQLQAAGDEIKRKLATYKDSLISPIIIRGANANSKSKSNPVPKFSGSAKSI